MRVRPLTSQRDDENLRPGRVKKGGEKVNSPLSWKNLRVTKLILGDKRSRVGGDGDGRRSREDIDVSLIVGAF